VIVGLPGAGISAFFYLLLVLLMPLKLAWRAIRRSGIRRGHVRLTARQLLIGLGILGSFSVIGLVLAAVLPEAPPVVETGGHGDATVVGIARGIARVGVYLGLGTLIAVLVVTRLLSLALSPRRAIPGPLKRRRVPASSRIAGFRSGRTPSFAAGRRARARLAASRVARAPE
jgi:hypothetical protein